MITLACGLRVYLALWRDGHGKGMVGLAMLVQQGLGADPFEARCSAFADGAPG